MLAIFEPEEGKQCDITQGSLVCRSGPVFKALKGSGGICRARLTWEPPGSIQTLHRWEVHAPLLCDGGEASLKFLSAL